MSTYFKVGQVVYSYVFENEECVGEVISINENETYPVKTIYKDVNGSTSWEYFTLDGKWTLSEVNPSLSQTPLPKIVLVPLTEVFDEGELVWCQIVNGEWDVRHYSHFGSECHNVYPDQKKTGTPINALKVQKFTDNPFI